MIVFWKQALFLGRTQTLLNCSVWAALRGVSGSSSTVPMGLWGAPPALPKCARGMLTHSFQTKKNSKLGSVHLPPRKNISLGKEARLRLCWCWLVPARHSSTETFLADGEFPGMSPSPPLHACRSGSYLLLRWHEAFLSDLLSFVEFLPSPAWKSPVSWEKRKEQFFILWSGLCASPQHLPEALEHSDTQIWAVAQVFFNQVRRKWSSFP